ncbi:MAG: OmpH family outer membrane protein [Rickettsiales bacterium]|jgi:Skp family chaperone for outer membrane proteins|nr:OmpH family outer membrane protein [Rickettsiales bacterium]
MKKIRKRISLLLLLLLCAIGGAAAAGTGVVNLEEAVRESVSFKKFNSDLEKEKDEIQELIRKREEELGKKKNDLESKSSILTKDALQAKAIEFQKEVFSFQDSVRQQENMLQEKLNKAVGILNGEIVKIVEEMVKEEKYSQYSRIVNAAVFLYYDKKDDLTLEVLKRLNKRKINLLGSDAKKGKK